MSNANDVMDFSDISTLTEVQVKNLGGKDYVLREATADVACRYQNRRAKCMKFAPDGGAASVEDIADTDPYLLSLCLFSESQKTPGVFDIPVPVTTIRSWKERVVRQLVKKLKEISELEDLEESVEQLEKRLSLAKKKAKTDEEALKNGPSSTTPTSE